MYLCCYKFRRSRSSSSILKDLITPTIHFRKPTTHRTKRILKNKEPKIIENAKQTLFIRGRKTRDVVLNCMKDMVGS